MPPTPGARNLITDVKGLLVGNAEDHRLKSGCTVILCEEPATAAYQALGGAPGTRETDLLEPHNTVQQVNAIVLSGGSAFGLDAASGAQAALRARGIGFEVGGHRVPIVPAAILFDLMNGGDKDWGRYPPYRELGHDAVEASGPDFELGSHGAGTGATVAGLKGGLGSASAMLENGTCIGALVASNALGSVTVGSSRHFWAAPFELAAEFGGLGLPHPLPAEVAAVRTKFSHPPANSNTVIGVVATDYILTKAEAKRLAISAHDGYSRAIWPSHTAYDGDLVFALATGASGRTPDAAEFIELCAHAASTTARAIARGVFSATPADGDPYPVWSSLR
ncbi:P1 family peptidase [Phyllobacterium sp. 21LDTY02-6]|uniref:P1 family peptidase n=1 Tax=unclassified Phyllobacterium TaxID=2638441 RepID=UPI00202248C7|nr:MULTISPECIES: P1 family peptidase [unclassified Phyllobacterium]MCO4316219.1 P1 family peptidase [Phyllobacterium sp. 21LDTY02-6]MCX8279358.1 P1 family peptidase [Phyllobacterium sp. 0TCS1.6C]MCX8292451.1 P1 family peptidase [Phyllobacterium sp. 0TCS1.6A]